jgi:peptidyl-prolyl cis-trans isomerase SurA
LIWALALFASASAGVVDRIAAVVEGEVIALSEVYELGAPYVEQACPQRAAPCVRQVEMEVLDALIRRTLIRQELSDLGLQVTATDVDQAIDRTVREFGLEDRGALRREVEASGKRWDQYRDELFEYLRTQNFQSRVLAPRVTINDDELRDAYKRSARREKKQVVSLSALGIVVPEGATADEEAEMIEQTQALVEALNAGAMEWSEAQADYDGAGLQQAIGGQSYGKGELVDPIDAAIFGAEVVPGQVLPPIRLGQVLAVVKVDERKEQMGEVLPFEEVKGELRNQLLMVKIEDAEEQWYQRARREAQVDVKL